MSPKIVEPYIFSLVGVEERGETLEGFRRERVKAVGSCDHQTAIHLEAS